MTGILTLQDVARNGRLLVTHDVARRAIIGLGPGETRVRELSWLDYSAPRDLSADGTMLLLDETGEGGGEGYSVYIRKTDGSPATRLGPGVALRLSPDGKWALAIVGPTSDLEIVVYPTSVGEPRRLPKDGLRAQVADWHSDGKRIILTASEPGRGMRLYLRDLEGGKARAFTPEGYRAVRRGVSPDGRFVAVVGPDQRFYVYPVEGGEPVPVPGVTAEDRVDGWSSDGKSLYVSSAGRDTAEGLSPGSEQREEGTLEGTDAYRGGRPGRCC